VLGTCLPVPRGARNIPPTRGPQHHRRNGCTTREACAYLRIGKSTLRTWISDGLIHPIRLGPKVLRFDTADLDSPEADAKGGSGTAYPDDSQKNDHRRSQDPRPPRTTNEIPKQEDNCGARLTTTEILGAFCPDRPKPGDYLDNGVSGGFHQ
jgi:excisionase family DNA binding protein